MKAFSQAGPGSSAGTWCASCASKGGIPKTEDGRSELIRTSDGVTFWMSDQQARRELGFSARDLDTGLRQTLEAG